MVFQKGHPFYRKEGYKHSEKAKRKMSEAHKGKHLIKEHRKKISEACKGKPSSMLGKHLTKEHKRKISIALKGRKRPPLSEETKRKLSGAHKGKHLTKKARRKISEALKGENHPNFQNWASREPYGEEWSPKLKEQIRKRDNYTCQECGHTQEELGYPLRVHHIDYNKKNNAVWNLISLCRNCHAQTNYKRADWINYFQNKGILRQSL